MKNLLEKTFSLTRSNPLAFRMMLYYDALLSCIKRNSFLTLPRALLLSLAIMIVVPCLRILGRLLDDHEFLLPLSKAR